MKIVHIVPKAPYNDNWGYQDNLLPKYQRKMGHEVTVITTNTMQQDGKIINTACASYTLEDGVNVIRRKRKKYFNRILTNLTSKIQVYDILKTINPDLIFYHGLESTTIYDVVRYKKNNKPECIIVEDNHADYNIGRDDRTWRDKVIRSFYRFINKTTIRYVSRVYGVTPWRKEYAEKFFGIPASKTDVLIMGADDEKIEFKNRKNIRAAIRKQYAIGEDEFLIVSGGKLDEKKKIIELIEASKYLSNVRILIFGQVNETLKDKYDRIINEYSKVISIGWVASDSVYDFFFAADLVVFPGQHSVLWEQACASKTPCLFARWPGMEHVNCGGNARFIDDLTVEGIAEEIKKLIFTSDYYLMKKNAESEKTDVFLYSAIAKKSLECVEEKS